MNSTGGSAWVASAGETGRVCAIALAAAANPTMNARLFMLKNHGILNLPCTFYCRLAVSVLRTRFR